MTRPRRRGAHRDLSECVVRGARLFAVRAPMSAPWWVYVLECERGVLYTGIARDVDARFALHVAGKGAAFTRRNRPVRILARTAVAERGTALRLEHDFKQLTRERKLWWCGQGLDRFPRRSPAAESDAVAGSA